MTKLLLKCKEHIHVFLSAGREIAVAAFGCKGMMVRSIPEHSGFTKTGSGSYNGNISFGRGVAFGKGDHFIFPQPGQTIGRCFKIIYKTNGNAHFLAHGFTVEYPGKIRELTFPVDYGSCYRGGY